MLRFKNKYKNSSDADLVSLYLQKRNQAVMTELFRRYQHVIRTVCWKYLKKDDCEDIASDVFEKFLTQIKNEIPQNIGGWIYTVSKNNCLSLLRKKGKVVNLETDEIEFYSTEDDHQNTEVLLQKLSKAVDQLKAGQKECIELFYLKEMTYEEISKQTGKPVKKIKSCLQNGRRNIQIFIKKHLKQS